MAGLLDLPDELLITMVSYLGDAQPFPSPIGQAGLASLCLSCHHLRDVAEPALYSTIQAPVLPCLLAQQPLEPLCKLLRTIFSRPDLALCVTKISLQAGPDIVNMKEVPMVRLQTHRDNAIISSISNAFSSTQPAATGNVAIEELVFILISSLPKLEDMHLQINSRVHKRLMGLFSDFMNKGSFPPSSLKGLQVGQTRRSLVAPNIVVFGPLVQWPHLRSFSMRFCTTYFSPKLFRDLYDLHPKGLGLTEFHLQECYITREALIPWLYACKGLKAFTFTAIKREITCGWIWFRQEHVARQLTPALLFEALESCVGTLEQLEADFHEYWGASTSRKDSIEDDDLSYTSFFSFKQLRRLSIEHSRLEFFEDLPPTLEALTLIRCGWSSNNRKDVKTLTKLKDDICPNIHLVRLHSVPQYFEKGELAKGFGDWFAYPERCRTGFDWQPELGFKLDIMD